MQKITLVWALLGALFCTQHIYSAAGTELVPTEQLEKMSPEDACITIFALVQNFLDDIVHTTQEKTAEVNLLFNQAITHIEEPRHNTPELVATSQENAAQVKLQALEVFEELGNIMMAHENLKVLLVLEKWQQEALVNLVHTHALQLNTLEPTTPNDACTAIETTCTAIIESIQSILGIQAG
ncbi:hypothetical protein K2W90_00440 [Candidatus Babeliales bacterium]|nr:hypothetical protein [Candidatus Babeliales bacterium]